MADASSSSTETASGWSAVYSPANGCIVDFRTPVVLHKFPGSLAFAFRPLEPQAIIHANDPRGPSHP